MLGRSATELRPGRLRTHHIRGLTAAVIAVTALVVAANAGPSDTHAPDTVQQVAAQDR
ncbi:hypothetical protein GCM10018787_16450 [Streptomyces thermodiastaticus]|nr:hypothetical protein GCM10018787_16450 [Streptomyces thermodiastaticus]